MASNYTEHYDLCQWEATDAVQRVEFNADNAKVDAALKALSDQVVQKANQSAVNTVISAVNQKADAATVNSLSSLLNSEIAQRQEEDSSLQSTLILKGNCQIYYGTYVGDGQDTRTLTFSGTPLLVLIQRDNLLCRGIQGNRYFMCQTNGGAGELCDAVWEGNSFTWGSEDDAYRANTEGKTYYVVALMAAGQ